MKKRPNRARPTTISGCPCDGKRPFAECCGPLLDGTREPVTAGEAMRARFAALAAGNAEHMWKSLHSEHDDRAHGREAHDAAFAKIAKTSRYRNFRLLDESPKDAHGVAQVLYGGELAEPHRTRAFVELASFVDEDGVPRYIAGVTKPASELAHGMDDLSISHWDCGHGHHH